MWNLELALRFRVLRSAFRVFCQGALDMDYSCLAVATEVGYRYPESGAGAVMSRQANLACGPPGSTLSKDSVTPEGRTTEEDEEDNEIGEASPDSPRRKS